MRCPKCSYISYDLIDTCVKCGKKIDSAATELQGTVAGVPAPAFLRMAGVETAPEELEESIGVETEEPLDLGDDEEAEMDFAIEEESSFEAEETELDLGVSEETPVEFGLAEETAAEEEPEIDLGVEEEPIGISDLAPEESEEDSFQVPVEEEFEIAEEEKETAAAAGQVLEDLKVEGIDLETAPDTSDSDKVMPSVKTGTALDDFDIDLGDLMSEKKD